MLTFEFDVGAPQRNSKDGRRWPGGDGVVITYINGIFHSVPEWESITHQLQAIFGHEVPFCVLV